MSVYAVYNILAVLFARTPSPLLPPSVSLNLSLLTMVTDSPSHTVSHTATEGLHSQHEGWTQLETVLTNIIV